MTAEVDFLPRHSPERVPFLAGQTWSLGEACPRAAPRLGTEGTAHREEPTPGHGSVSLTQVLPTLAHVPWQRTESCGHA